MFEPVLAKFKGLLKNPMMLFIYAIVSKWYITIFVTVIAVTFWIFTGLNQAGILKQMEEVVVKAFKETKAVAQFCTPKILSFGDFWDCLQNPPEYVPSDDEKSLEKGMQNLIDPTSYNNPKDPYDNDAK